MRHEAHGIIWQNATLYGDGVPASTSRDIEGCGGSMQPYRESAASAVAHQPLVAGERASERHDDDLQQPTDRVKHAHHSRTIMQMAVVSGVIGTVAGCLAGAMTPGGAYVSVSISVAGITAVLVGWHFDRISALLMNGRRFRPHV